MKNWKSTAAGVLSFLTVTLTTISALLAGNDLSAGGGIHTLHISTWVVIGVNGGLALCRAWVGWLQNDAPPGDQPAQNKPRAMSKGV